jgi:ornithine cyclodeaminase
MRVVGADELRAALPMAAAVDALETAFRDEGPSGAGPVRSSVDTPAGSLLLMPAAGARGVGVKLVTLTEANPAAGLPFVQAAYVLFDPGTQAPLATLDGTALTALRTAAVSGLATRFLAPDDAHRLVLFGAGVQAFAHLEAMAAVRPIEEVVVVSRSPARAEALVAAARARGLRADTGGPDAVGSADLICTCTTSPTPVFDARVADGAHLNAVGAYRPDTREIDTETVRRARVVVETREVAAAEAGDVVVPIAEGAIGAGHVVADLHELVRGTPVRRDPRDVTLFVSVGMAFEDLVVAHAIVEALT